MASGGGDDNEGHRYEKFALAIFKILDGPVTAVREKIIEPIQSQNKYPYYHRRFRRVPTVDECDYNDAVCIFEADQQYKRDKMVDEQIVKILRHRKNECKFWEGPDAKVKCRKICQDYDHAATNWFIKYGDIGANANVISAYMKQKHRLIWERRNPDNIMRS